MSQLNDTHVKTADLAHADLAHPKFRAGHVHHRGVTPPGSTRSPSHAQPMALLAAAGWTAALLTACSAQVDFNEPVDERVKTRIVDGGGASSPRPPRLSDAELSGIVFGDDDGDGFLERSDDGDMATVNVLEVPLSFAISGELAQFSSNVRFAARLARLPCSTPQCEGGAMVDGFVADGDVAIDQPLVERMPVPRADGLALRLLLEAFCDDVLCAEAYLDRVVDTEAPELTIALPAEISESDDQDAAPGIQHQAQVVGSGWAAGSAVVAHDAVNGAVLGSAVADADEMMLPLTFLAVGARTVLVNAVDAAGNAASDAVTVVVRRAAPQPQLISLDVVDTRRGRTRAIVSWGAMLPGSEQRIVRARASALLSPDGAGAALAQGFTQLHTELVPVGAGANHAEIDLDVLAFDVPLTIEVAVEDNAGSWSIPASGTLTAATQVLRLSGAQPGWGRSLSVQNGGDLNGDGFNDVAVGVATDDGEHVGGFEVVFGAATGAHIRRSGVIELPAHMPSCADSLCSTQTLGTAVSMVPDLDADGADELAVVAFSSDRSAAFVLVYRGADIAAVDPSADGAPLEPALTLGWPIDDEQAPVTIGAIGDWDGDGASDWAVGTSEAGALYVIGNTGSLAPAVSTLAERAIAILFSSAPDAPLTGQFTTVTRADGDALALASLSGVWRVSPGGVGPIDLMEEPGVSWISAADGPLAPCRVSAGDADGDGDDDLFVLRGQDVLVLENYGGSWVPRQTVATPLLSAHVSARAHDVHGDGSVDLWLPSADGAVALVWGDDVLGLSRRLTYTLAGSEERERWFTTANVVDDDRSDLLVLESGDNAELLIRY